MTSFAVFACTSAYAVVSSLAVSIDDYEMVSDDYLADETANQSTNRQGCDMNTGGTCGTWPCNAARGQNTCHTHYFSSDICVCNDGYCAGGSFFQSHITYDDRGKYCLQTCKAWQTGHSCNPSTENPVEDSHICSYTTCSKRECCIPKDQCNKKDCNSETEVLTTSGANGKYCQGEDCRASECCVARAKCNGGECSPSSQIQINTGSLCTGMSCEDSECCAAREECDPSQCDAETSVSVVQGTLCKGIKCEEEECCKPRGQCVAGFCDSETEVMEVNATLCEGTRCEKEECCLPRGDCNDTQCDPASHVHIKNATLCTGTDCNNVECCAPRGKCGDFKCLANTISKGSNSTTLCKGRICQAPECCSVPLVAMPRKIKTPSPPIYPNSTLFTRNSTEPAMKRR